jgi:hypothetical protein
LVQERTPEPPRPRRFAVLIGDVRGSRQHADRRRLQERLEAALADVNRHVPAAQPLSITLGDEFQGAYESQPDALRAAVLLWLSLTEVADLRFGMGWGEIPIRNDRQLPFAQDGPAWWEARDALKRLRKEETGQYRPDGWALAYSEAEDESRRRWVNAIAILLGATMVRMTVADRALALGLLLGKTLQQMAKQQRITAGSASARATRNGPYALLRFLQELAGSPQ